MTWLSLAVLVAALCLMAVPTWVHKVFGTKERDKPVSVIDTTTWEVTHSLAVGRRPRGITFSRDRLKLSVCASDSDAVQLIDPATGTLLHNLPSGEDPDQFALSPDNRTLFIANEDNATTVADAKSRKVRAQIDISTESEGMAVGPDGLLAVTISETTNMVH